MLATAIRCQHVVAPLVRTRVTDGTRPKSGRHSVRMTVSRIDLRSMGPAAAATVGVGRELAGRVLQRIHSPAQHESHSGTMPTTVRCGGVVLRPLTPTDQVSWTAAMRANEERMSLWWAPGSDWLATSSSQAYYEHYVTWQRMERRGAGRLRAITDGRSVVGELAMYAQSGGKVQEFGLWCAPHAVSALDLFGALCGTIDALISVEGVERIDGPVAAGNRQPVRFLTAAGFQHEGTLRGWRPLGGQMVDMDMYGLTKRRWTTAREAAYRRKPWGEPAGRSASDSQPRSLVQPA